MKQNERLLVYAVTGFLALILVVALVFSPETGKNPLKSGTGAQGLDDILGNKPIAAETKKEPAPAPAAAPAAAPATTPTADSLTGLPSPKAVTPEQPLNAVTKAPLLAADLVLQALGPSRSEHGVRFVRALRNDSLDILVKRWCGARDPYLAEAKALNEDLQVLRAGQEVAVPLVSDEVLLAAIEAQKPKLMTPTDKPTTAGAIDALLADAGADKGKASDAGATGSASKAVPTPAVVGKTDFVQPGAGVVNANAKNAADGARMPAAASGTSYTVKEKDSLWGIASKTYGKKNADRMIPRIKDANPGLADNLRPGQKLVLPAAEAPAKSGA